MEDGPYASTLKELEMIELENFTTRVAWKKFPFDDLKGFQYWK